MVKENQQIASASLFSGLYEPKIYSVCQSNHTFTTHTLHHINKIYHFLLLFLWISWIQFIWIGHYFWLIIIIDYNMGKTKMVHSFTFNITRVDSKEEDLCQMKNYVVLAPSGAQGVTLCVRPAQICLKHWIFISLSHSSVSDLSQVVLRSVSGQSQVQVSLRSS